MSRKSDRKLLPHVLKARGRMKIYTQKEWATRIFVKIETQDAVLQSLEILDEAVRIYFQIWRKLYKYSWGEYCQDERLIYTLFLISIKRGTVLGSIYGKRASPSSDSKCRELILYAEHHVKQILIKKQTILFEGQMMPEKILQT